MATGVAARSLQSLPLVPEITPFFFFFFSVKFWYWGSDNMICLCSPSLLHQPCWERQSESCRLSEVINNTEPPVNRKVRCFTAGWKRSILLVRCMVSVKSSGSSHQVFRQADWLHQQWRSLAASMSYIGGGGFAVLLSSFRSFLLHLWELYALVRLGLCVWL